MRKELRKIMKAVEEQGFAVRQTSKQHYEVRFEGRKVATFSGSPSDHRSWRNAIQKLKRLGFRWPP